MLANRTHIQEKSSMCVPEKGTARTEFCPGCLKFMNVCQLSVRARSQMISAHFSMPMLPLSRQRS